MKFLIERAEHNDGITKVVLRFGDISISGFEAMDGGGVFFPDNVEIPFELQDNVKTKLRFAHIQMKNALRS